MRTLTLVSCFSGRLDWLDVEATPCRLARPTISFLLPITDVVGDLLRLL
jgi:hypothetical protein